MKTKRGFIIAALGVCLMVGLVISPTYAKSPGVTDKEIIVGGMGGITGPAAMYGKAAKNGMDAYFNEINAQGGIHGRKVKVVFEDHQWNPARAVSAYKYLVDQVGVFSILANAGTATSMALMDKIEEDKVPMFPTTWAKMTWVPPRRYAFPTVTSYGNQIGVLMDYMMENFKPKSPKVGVIYLADDYGKAILEGTDVALKYYNLKIHAKQSFKRADVDFSSQVSNLQRAGCEYVVLGTTSPQAANIIKEAARLKYAPQWLGAPGPTVKFTILLTGKLMPANFLGSSCIAEWTENVPGMVKLRAMAKKYHPEYLEKEPVMFYPWLYAVSMVATEAMKRAGRNLTRESFVNAMETINNFDTGGLLPAISYGPGKREACSTSRALKVDLNKKSFVPVTGWIKPKFLK